MDRDVVDKLAEKIMWVVYAILVIVAILFFCIGVKCGQQSNGNQVETKIEDV